MVGVAVVPPETIPGPAQLKVTGEVEEDAEIVGVVHVTACEAAAVTFGGVPLGVRV